MMHSFKQDRFQPNPKTGQFTYGEGFVPEYTIFNLKSSYEVNKNWKLSLGIENLLINFTSQPLHGGMHGTTNLLILWG